MTGLYLKFSLIYFSFSFLGDRCQSTLLKFNPEGTEFVKQINDSFYISCFYEHATNVWWYKNKQNISDLFTRVHVERTSDSSSSQAALFFSSIQASDSGSYTCNGTINNVTVSSSFLLRTFRPITFRDTESVQSVWENEESVLRCEADGEPEPALSWFVDGKHAEVYTAYKQLGDGLLIKNVSLKDEKREFICRAAAINNVTSNIALKKISLIVLHAPKLKGPKEMAKYAFVGGTVNLTCEVDSNPPANFTWLRNNTEFSGEENVTIITERNKSILQMGYVDNSWFERYLCRAANEKGGLTIGFNLTKIAKPEPPKKAKIHSTTYDSLQLDIHTPPSKYEDILGYKVQIMEKREKEMGKEWQVAREVFLLKDEPYVITGLKPNTEYLVRVTSQNRAGAGEFTSEMKTKTLRSSAPSCHTISTGLFLGIPVIFFALNYA